MSTITAGAVAEYFLLIQDEDDCITNMKLQKLLYYAQGFHLAFYAKPLFHETIEAWTHGPVVPIVYRLYKEHGRNPIPIPEVEVRFEPIVNNLLDEVYGVFGKYSANELRNMTHKDTPYILAENKLNKKIDLAVMHEHFMTKVVDGKED